MINYRGFAPIDRQLYLEDPIFQCERFDKAHAYLDLLIQTNHTDSFFIIAGIQITVKRGQIARSQKQLAERWSWDAKTVNKFLKMLEKNGYIRFERFPKKNPKLTIITLLKYEINTRIPTNLESRFPSGMDSEVIDKLEIGVDTYNNEENEKNEINVNKYEISPIEELEKLRAQILTDLDVAMKDYSDEDFNLAVDIIIYFYISCRWSYFPVKVETPMPEMMRLLIEAFNEIGSTDMKNQFRDEAGYLTFGAPDEFQNATVEEVFLNKLAILRAKQKTQQNHPNIPV
jgi:hypothetical protein